MAGMSQSPSKITHHSPFHGRSQKSSPKMGVAWKVPIHLKLNNPVKFSEGQRERVKGSEETL